MSTRTSTHTAILRYNRAREIESNTAFDAKRDEHNLGALQRHLLSFARKYPQWQGYADDAMTLRVVNSLVMRGLIEVNEFQQFRAIE